MARTYKRDARGRFAGGGGGGGRKGVKLPAPSRRTAGSKPQKRRGLLIQRGSLARSQAKLKVKDPADKTIKGQLSRRSQKGAVTKASKALQAGQQSGRARLSGRGGVIRPGAKKAAHARPATRVDGDAFAARMKRARGTSQRRYINDSDRENALTGAQRRATAPSKRFAAINQRQARAERTTAAAQAFYRSYGSASAFGSRTRQSTATSPNFGSKRRRRK
mgnify:CR=1 FL=1